jgi:predicted O-linked N-acetylglucosamine transferase (SPINDLY family)
MLADVGSRAKTEAITAVFAREGIIAERLTFAPRADLLSYYRLFDSVDIALDTHPYGGGTTTLDALWMGVPVFSLAGELPVSRSAASILQTLGLPEWIAESPPGYVEQAVARASNLKAVAALRAQLRERLRNSAFMEEGRFARDFEDTLRAAWAKYCASQAASAAAVKVDWRARGNAALQSWDLNFAEDCYRQAVLQEPEDAGARVNLGFVLLEKDHASSAIDQLVQALALLRPDDDVVHDAHFLMGRAHAKQGHVDEALASFAAAVAAKADFAEAMEEAASVMHEAGRHEEMLSWGRRMQGVRPSAGADLIVAQSLHALKRDVEALGLLEAAVRREPGNAAVHRGRGDLFMALGRAQEALQAFEQAGVDRRGSR